MEDFQKQYALLNDKQREAVQAISGPVLVIAGPGTGKTQLLGMRVAQILRETDAAPENILCLTFTNKAATNMRERLVRLIGSEGRKVQVKTFHSFAAEIMNQYPDYFWNGARLSTIPETTQLEIIETILKKLPFDNPLALRFAGKYTSTGAVVKALKLTKDAGLTPEKLRAIIAANMAYIEAVEPQIVDILSKTISHKRLSDLQAEIDNLPDQPIDATIAPLISLKTVLQESLAFAVNKDLDTGKAANTSKWKGKWIKAVDGKKGMWDERSRNKWWLELADVYQSYRETMHSQGYYDYSDMLVEVLSQLEQNPELRADVQEQYQFVLIDEFQDSNAAQLRLAHLVADHESASGQPNIMAVGDDDQSIFGFNGAELNNMLFFDRTYGKTTKIVLEENYRSNQAILDASGKIIEQAIDRLVTRDTTLSKRLVVAREKRAGDISHMQYATREQQLHGVVEQIKRQRSAKPGESIAVLARSHDSLQALAALLLRSDVPVRYEKRNNILEYEAIQQAILLCKILSGIHEGNKDQVNAHLASLLRHPMWELSAETLWSIAIDAYKTKDWLLAIKQNSETKDIADWLLWLSGKSSHQPLALTIEYVLGLRPGEPITSPIQKYFVSEQRISGEYLQTLSALQLLRHLVNDFSVDIHPSLKDLLHFIQLNQENEKGITDESPFVSDEHAVELYSIHKAKGLEFDNVYIIDAVEDNWKPKSGGRKPPANLPLQPPLETDDDYIRLLYVAATRAKHTLITTSYSFDHANNEVLATPLLHAAIPKTSTIDKPTEKEAVHILEEGLRWPHLSEAKEKVLLEARLERFSINVTNLLNFLDVTRGGPQYFFERNVLYLPEAKTATLAHGTAAHAALELAQKDVNADKFKLSDIIDEYVDTLEKEHLPSNEFKRYKAHGQQMLSQLFEIYTLPKGSKPEQRLTDVRLSSAVIDGKLDRIDIDDNTLTIVDYKTGSILPSFDTTSKTLSVKAWRQKTQLIFYALLAQNHPRFSKFKDIKGQIVYVEAKSDKELVRTYKPSQEEIDRLEKLIEAVWAKVKAVDFPNTTSYSPDIAGTKQFEKDLLDGKI